MKSKKFGFLRHYRKIKIEGINLTRMVDKCIREGIDLRKLQFHNTLESTAELKADDYERFMKIAGHSYNVSVMKEGGIKAFIKMLKSNMLTVAGAFIAGALIFYQSLFIAEIRIDGYSKITETEIREVLELYGVSEGRRRLENYNEARNGLYKSFDELTWVSFYEKGRLLKVNVAEAGRIDESEKIETAPVHIVASQSGIIEKIIPEEGNAKVKKGDYVNEGDILISGKYKYRSTDYSKGDRVFTMYSHARGPVLAKVPLQLNFYMEKNTRKLSQTGKFVSGILIEAGDIRIDTARPFCTFKVSQRKERKLIDMTRYFPLKICSVKIQEMIISERHQDMKKAEEVVSAAVRQYTKERFKEGEKVLSQTIEFNEGRQVVEAEVFLEVIRDIGVEKPVKINKNK